MKSHCGKLLLSLVIPLALSAPALGQDAAATKPAAAPTLTAAHPARELTVSKCFQCHSEAMWRDQRQDARAWEAALYRMVARGAIWSGEDIKIMAAFLAADFGPNAPRAAPVAR